MDFDLLNQNEKAIDLMTGISTRPEDLKKAPDCVCKTIFKRMEELNQEISDCEELLSKGGEYALPKSSEVGAERREDVDRYLFLPC